MKRSAISLAVGIAVAIIGDRVVASTSMRDSSTLSPVFRPCVPYVTAGRSEACPAGYTGSRNYNNNYTCATAYGYPRFSGESLAYDGCVAVPPPVVASAPPPWDSGGSGGGDGGGGSGSGGGGCGGSGSGGVGGCGASGDGGGGGGGGCFIGSTLVRMDDGSLRRIDEVRMGDHVIDALTGDASRVIGIKRVMNPPGRTIFSPSPDLAPFMTEEHPWYDASGRLCAISSLCTELAPWLGDVQQLPPAHAYVPDQAIPVYNLMLESGSSHFANGIPVSNITGNGGMYVLAHKGFASQEDYVRFMSNPENLSVPATARVRLFRVFQFVGGYILAERPGHQVLGRLVTHLLTTPAYREAFQAWANSGVRRALLGAA